MGGCSGQTKQASEVLGKALSLSPGWGLACPGPPPHAGQEGMGVATMLLAPASGQV